MENDTKPILFYDTEEHKENMQIHVLKHGYGSLSELIRKATRFQMKVDNEGNLLWVRTRK